VSYLELVIFKKLCLQIDGVVNIIKVRKFSKPLQCRSKFYWLRFYLTQLWHRSKPNLTSSSLPEADSVNEKSLRRPKSV